LKSASSLNNDEIGCLLACFQMSGKLITIVMVKSINSAPLVNKRKVTFSSILLGYIKTLKILPTPNN